MFLLQRHEIQPRQRPKRFVSTTSRTRHKQRNKLLVKSCKSVSSGALFQHSIQPSSVASSRPLLVNGKYSFPRWNRLRLRPLEFKWAKVPVIRGFLQFAIIGRMWLLNITSAYLSRHCFSWDARGKWGNFTWHYLRSEISFWIRWTRAAFFIRNVYAALISALARKFSRYGLFVLCRIYGASDQRSLLQRYRRNYVRGIGRIFLATGIGFVIGNACVSYFFGMRFGLGDFWSIFYFSLMNECTFCKSDCVL